MKIGFAMFATALAFTFGMKALDGSLKWNGWADAIALVVFIAFVAWLTVRRDSATVKDESAHKSPRK